MQNHTNGRSGTIICYLVMVVLSASAVSPAASREIQVDGLPCNELCQAWLGYDTHVGDAGSMSEKRLPIGQPFIQHGRSVTSEPPLKVYRPRTESVKIESHRPIIGRSAPEPLRTVVSPKHVQPQVRVARETAPLPIRRPTISGGRPTLAVAVPALPTLRPSETARRPSEAANTPNAGSRRTAALDPAPPPAANRPIDTSSSTDKPNPQKGPDRAAPSAASVASTPPASSPSPPEPRIAANPPIDDRAQSPSKTDAPVAPSIAGKSVNAPSSPEPIHLSASPPPPAVVASLPSPVDAESVPRGDPEQTRDTQEGALRSSPPPASTSLSVKIGQISPEPRGTDVHIMVVNVLPNEMRDIDVRCRARDAQGLQVAEVSTRIANVPPSDITFGRVLFPSEITTKDNVFTCEIGKVADTDDIMP